MHRVKMSGLQSNDMACGCTCVNLSLCAASRYAGSLPVCMVHTFPPVTNQHVRCIS